MGRKNIVRSSKRRDLSIIDLLNYLKFGRNATRKENYNFDITVDKIKCFLGIFFLPGICRYRDGVCYGNWIVILLMQCVVIYSVLTERNIDPNHQIWR